MSAYCMENRRQTYRILTGVLLLFWIVGAGCYTKNIEEAFNGEFPAKKNNRIITEYCQSCHLHRGFTPEAHVSAKVLKYKRKVFRFAEECRVCHYLEKKFALNDFTRKTRRADVASTLTSASMELVETLRGEVDALRDEQKALRIKIDELKADIEAIGIVSESRQSQIDKLKARIDEANRIIDAQEKRIAHLEQILRENGIDPTGGDGDPNGVVF